jgi:SAM-dependent methyltransferase
MEGHVSRFSAGRNGCVDIGGAALNPPAPLCPDVTDDRERWNEKYSTDEEFELPNDPIPELARRIDTLPTGRALDVATGTGRNARFLAAEGYDVDAVDVSDEALDRAARAAAAEGVDVNWIRSDIDDFEFGRGAYDVITVSFFAALEHLPNITAALAPGGVLVYEHHLRSSDDIDIGPSSDRYRYPSNHLLHACLDLTILHYEERTRLDDEGRTQAVATLVGRRSTGGEQSYPRLEG